MGKAFWILSFLAWVGVAGGGIFWLVKHGPDTVPAAFAGKANSRLTWTVSTGEGLPVSTAVGTIRIDNGSSDSGWGPGKLSVRMPDGRTLEYTVERFSPFQVKGTGLEVRLKFPKQPFAAAHTQARTLLADWKLSAIEQASLDRWHAKRTDPNNLIPSTTWVSTINPNLPAIVVLMQPDRQQDQWVLILQVFPKNVRAI
jgi:hypothetical protein